MRYNSEMGHYETNNNSHSIVSLAAQPFENTRNSDMNLSIGLAKVRP